MTADGAYREIKKFYRRYPHTRGGEYTLISDNLYLIQQRVAAVGRIKEKRLAQRVSRCLARAQYDFGADGLIEYFGNRGWDMGIREVYALRDVLCTLLVSAVAEECRLFTDTARGSAVKMRAAIESLRRLPELELSAVFAALCPAERLFSAYAGFTASDSATRDMYRAALIRYAKRRRMSEREALAAALSECSDGRLLRVLSPRSAVPAVLYYTITGVAAAAALFLCVSAFGAVALFAALPLYESALCLGDFIFSRAVRTLPPPRLKAEDVPADAKTLTVVTTLLFGGEKDAAVFDRLEEFYLRNRRKGLYFGVLGDLCDSRSPSAPDDRAAIEYAEKRIRALNAEYGGVFGLFVREREKNEADGIWGGRERKRGAVCALVSAIRGSGGFANMICPFGLDGIRYILTLDSDTELPIDGAADLLRVALHPENTPEVSDGQVIAGYGIFQPSVRTRLSDSTKTYHSLFGSVASGIYERASYDRYQTLLGSGVFCGKGLIDVALFASLALPAVPDGRILSHDVIEGGLLRCMLVSDVTFTDSTPKNSVSYCRRQHRWARGDVQNMSMLASPRANAALSFRIIENFRRLITPLSAAGIAVCAFTGDGLMLLPLISNILTPTLLGFAGTLSARLYTPRRFFSCCIGAIAQNAANALYSFAALPETARVAADALIRSFWRMAITKRRLLQWTAFSQTDATLSRSLGYFVREHVASVFCGTVITAFSLLPVYRICGLIWFAYPFVAYMLSRPIGRAAPSVTGAQKNTVAVYAAECFAFFDQNVSRRTHFLPPDNIQLSPATSTAMRTSPTNIGFYAVSLVAARDFGIIDSASLYERLSAVMRTVGELEKYRGHLFNWYDLKTLKPIGGRYVSTVDSGNFVTMLLAAAAGAEEYAGEYAGLSAIADKCRAIADETDFGFLYNEKKSMLYLGCTAGESPAGGICYDMLMSEIRTTCYWLCASGKLPCKLWRSLSRTITAENGFIGMVSWAGSCFEYFMPELFLPREKDSFIDESLRFALFNQKKHRRNGIFGISESGFYAFDSNMNYRYKAHGVPSLALKKYPSEEFVASPYSSFLMLRDDAAACLKNLARFEDAGCRGKYGFYEALDMTSGESVVQSYMAHHVGMSLIACADACFDSVFARRFMRDKQLDACRELLAESIPRDAELYVDEGDRRASARDTGAWSDPETRAPSLTEPSASVCGGGGLTLIASSSGHIAMKCGFFAVNDAEFSLYSSARTAYFTFFGDGEKKAFTPLDGNMAFSFERSGGHFAFVSSSPDFPASVTGTVYRSCRTFAFRTRAAGDRLCRVGFSFVPVLREQSGHDAHRAFSSLFIEAEYDAAERVLFYSRRGDAYPCCAVALADASAELSFTADAEHLPAHSVRSMSDAFPLPEHPGTGVCVNPLCALLTPETKGGGAIFLVTCGDSRAECAEQIRRARRKAFPRQFSAPYPAVTSSLLSACLFQIPAENAPDIDSSCLWRLSLSGGCPLAVLSVYGDTPAVSGLLRAYLQLRNAFLRTELLFIVHEREKYSAPLRNAVIEAIGAEYAPYLSENYGIAVADADSFTPDELSFIRSFAAYYAESDGVDEPPRQAAFFIPPEAISAPQPGVAAPEPRDGVYICDRTEKYMAPYSYVMSGYAAGAVVTHATLGFAFWRNARECRLTPFSGDPFAADNGLRLLVLTGGRVYDVAASAAYVSYGHGAAVYNGCVEGHCCRLTVCVRAKLPATVYGISFDDGFAPLCVFVRKQPPLWTSAEHDGTVTFRSMERGAVRYCGFMSCAGECDTVYDTSALFCGVDSGRRDITALCRRAPSAIFCIGGAPTEAAAAAIAPLCCRGDIEAEAEAFADRYTPGYRLSTGNAGLDGLFSHFAPYQVSASRFFGKTGFYQTGGAYGFRDQLQDCFCLIYSSPETVRTHLIRCCAHQYSEGDVMHWWFRASGCDKGIRTMCSDDFLYLPWAVADYIEKTGDVKLLDVRTGYVSSPPLTQSERFETPGVSDARESVYMHCIRALLNGEKTGAHGLSLMGSCDWNDGMSAVGSRGKGESVFTSWLFVLVCRAFVPVMKLVGDVKSISHFTEASARVLLALGQSAYDTDRYIRAFADDGTVIGSRASRECTIDILSQAFAAIVCGRTERTVKALSTATSALFDPEAGIFKLFSPPFAEYDAGYISDYCRGVRENGGQYTHGALWGVLGLIRCGETVRAIEILNAIMPYSHTDRLRYKIEPYVIPADIYGGQRAGRGGWSWYTGSAAWFFRIVLEELLGIRLTDGFSVIYAEPLIDYTLTLPLPRGTLTVSASSLYPATNLDSAPVRFPMLIPEGDHRLEIRREAPTVFRRLRGDAFENGTG